ncbi:MAG: hypothetical protein HC919_12035 [Oscillatoriales cyanobacterium SM2_2_1]|nr:hypothetical protein [Oscillatoriales cyanobacterium SM2_2_1]
MTVFPLFHPRTIEQGLSAFGIPDDLPRRIERFVNSEPEADAPHGMVEWIHDLFVQVLGYRSPFEAEAIAWELELHPQICLGFFTEESTSIIAEIFWLGPGQLGGQKPTPTFPSSQWLLSLNRQRIYIHRQDTPFLFCQQFAWHDLRNIDLAQQFYFLLCRRTMLPRTPQGREPSRTQQLFHDSQKYELQTRKTFTSHLSKVRSQLIRDFRYRLLQGTSDPDGITSVAIAQSEKLLHRVLIIATCQGQNLLPTQLLSDAYEFVNPYREQPVWENFAAIFRWLHKGYDRLTPPISPLDCPLFQPDPLLDQVLTLGNELCRQLKELAHLLVNLDLSPSAMAFALDASLLELQAIAPNPLYSQLCRHLRRQSVQPAAVKSAPPPIFSPSPLTWSKS